MTLPANFPVFVGVTRPILLVDSIAILRTQPSPNLAKGQPSLVYQGSIYYWNPDSTDPDDGRAVIKPDDVPEESPGRWNSYTGGGGGIGIDLPR